MDLTAGITQMQSQLRPDMFAGYQAGANAYATAEKNGQEIASNRIKNENAQREQDLQTRLQKVIEESFDPATGQPDYDKMAVLGHKYGITAQQMDYSIKHLKDNWDAISGVAQNKQTTGSIAQPGWNTSSPKAPATEQTATQPVAPTVPTVAPEAQESTTKGTAAPTTQAPFKQIPELTDAQKALTGADGYTDSKIGATNEIIGGLNTAVAQSGNPTGAPIPVRPLVSTPAINPLTGEQVGTAGDGKVAIEPQAPVMDLGQQTITAKAPTEAPKTGHTLYQNVANMDVQNFSGIGGSGDAGSTGVPATISSYTIPRNVYTGPDGKVHAYTPEELTANPSLDIAKSAEAFFRGQTGDNTSTPDKVAQDYLGSVYANSLAANGAPVPPPRPMVATPAAVDKWRQDMVAWQNSNAKAIGKANQDVQEVKSAVAKGRFDLAEKILKTQTDTINIDGKEYRAYNGKSRDAVASLNAIDPIADNLAHEIASLKKTPGDTTTLQTLIPTFARVMGARMNPGSQISMGNIDESKMSSMIEDGKHAGLSVGGALAALAGWMVDPAANKKSFLQYAKEYATGAIKNISNTGIIEKMEAQLKASKESSELYKAQNLIGYKYTPKGGDAPSSIPAPTPESEYTPKTGWYNQPTGTRFKLDPEDPNSLTGMVTEASTNDVTGESKASKVKLEDGTVYNVNEGDPESEDVELTPWNKAKPNAPVKPAKKGAKAPAKPAKAEAKKKVW